MNPTDDFKIRQEWLFQLGRKQHSESADKCLKYLNSEKMEILYQKHQEFQNNEYECSEFTVKLIGCLSGLKFLPYEMVSKKLNQFNIPNSISRYFISIEEIKKEIDVINQSEFIYLSPFAAYNFTRHHLDSKLISFILNSNKNITYKKGNGKYPINTLSAKLISYKQKGIFNKNKSPNYNTSTSDFILKSEYQKIDNLFDEFDLTDYSYLGDSYKQLQNFCNGKSYLQELITCSYVLNSKNNISKQKLYFIFYPLLSLVRNEDIHSKEEFEFFQANDFRSIEKYFYNDIIKNQLKVTLLY